MQYKSLAIVPPSDIPTEIVPCPVSDLVELSKLCLQMEHICREENGIGLAAVQLGIPWKLFVVRYDLDFFSYYVNCEYEPIGDEKEKSLEGCLSLKTPEGKLRYFEVERYRKVRLRGQELKLDPKPILVDVNEEIVDYYRVVVQHEIDHHRGILISDIGAEIEIWKN